MKKKWVVCNVNGSTHQRRFRIHDSFADAVTEANRLAGQHAGTFMVMETVGGFAHRGSRVVPVEIEEEG